MVGTLGKLSQMEEKTPDMTIYSLNYKLLEPTPLLRAVKKSPAVNEKKKGGKEN